MWHLADVSASEIALLFLFRPVMPGSALQQTVNCRRKILPTGKTAFRTRSHLNSSPSESFLRRANHHGIIC